MSTILSYLLNYFSRSSTLYVRFAHVRFTGRDLSHPFEWAIAITFLLVFCVFNPQRKRPKVLKWLSGLAQRKRYALMVVFSLSIGGRLILLSIEPFPAPSVHDEFSYLLGADMFAHGQVANATPLDSEHFEAFHILLEPTYASMYPPASALFYGFGQVVFRTPRAGLLLLMGLACMSLCWMLQAFVPPEWALLGGILAVVHISWFSYFGNTYWGGAAAMLGGCTLLGASRRVIVEHGHRRFSWILLSLALLLLLNCRPFEGFVIFVPVLISLALGWRGRSIRPPSPAAILILGIGVLATAGYAITITHGAQLPWSLQRKQWAITPPFIFQHAAYGHTYAFKDQRGLYEDYELHDYVKQHHLRGFVSVLADKTFREWLFFISPALTLCFLFGLAPTIRSSKNRPAIIGLAILCCASCVETWVQPQYMAVATGAIYLLLINGLRHSVALSGRKRVGAAVFPAAVWSLGFLLCVRFFFVPVVSWPPSWDTRSYELLSYEKLRNRLEAMPGKQLILVHYDSNHRWMDSWINNGADISSQKLIWARDIGSLEEERQFLCDYPGRNVWMVTPPLVNGLEIDPDRTDPARNFDVSGLLKLVKTPDNACP